jgi:hypothetical protein
MISPHNMVKLQVLGSRLFSIHLGRELSTKHSLQ